MFVCQCDCGETAGLLYATLCDNNEEAHSKKQAWFNKGHARVLTRRLKKNARNANGKLT